MLRTLRSNKSFLIAAGLLLVGVLALVVSTALLHVKKANDFLKAEKKNASQQDAVQVAIHPFSVAANPKQRLLTGPPETRDACEFQGKIWAATSAGLFAYSPKGEELEHWTTAEGLPSLDLTALAVHDHQLWIGTSDSGLLTFNGESQWRQFLPEPEFSSITSLLSTPQGSLFIGTNAGLIRFAARRFEKFHSKQLEQQTITKLAGEDHHLFIGTFQNGLFLHQNGSLQNWNRENGLKDPLITDLRPTSHGCLVSTPAGIQILLNADAKGVFLPIATNVFVTSFEQVDNEIFASTRDHGVIRISNDPTMKGLRPKIPASYRAIRQLRSGLLKKISGTLLAFTSEKSWTLNNSHQWNLWNESKAPLSSSNISAILKTRSNDLYIGYFDAGIDVLSPDLKLKTHDQDETLFCINHLSQDEPGNIYISTANGLVILHPSGTKEIYRETDGLLSNRVMATIPLDREGKRVAIATAQGFTLKEGGELRSIYAFNGLVNNHVYAMEAEANEIFLGTLGGISRVANMHVVENWTHADSGLRQNWINALARIDDRLFIGTYGGGVQVRTENGEWINFESLPEKFEVNPNAFFYDGRYLFCGTLDRGFYIHQPATGSWRHEQDHLPGRNVTGFAVSQPSLYIGTDRGLLQISYDNIDTMSAL